MTSHDIILPPAAVDGDIAQSKVAAFVPITLAVLGVVAILLGGVSARQESAAVSVQPVDPVTTGSILSPDAQRRAMEMLDR
jgi:hypothetical protein